MGAGFTLNSAQYLQFGLSNYVDKSPRDSASTLHMRITGQQGVHFRKNSNLVTMANSENGDAVQEKTESQEVATNEDADNR